MLPWGYSQCTARMVVARQMSLNLACKMLQTESELFNSAILDIIVRYNEVKAHGPKKVEEGWQASQTLWANGMRFQCKYINYINMHVYYIDVHRSAILLLQYFRMGSTVREDWNLHSSCCFLFSSRTHEQGQSEGREAWAGAIKRRLVPEPRCDAFGCP